MADQSAAQASLWRFGELEFDELRRELRLKGRAVELESKPLELLLQLLRHAGEVLTKEELLDSVWPGVITVEGSLTTAISKLRKAIGDDEQTLIVTVPRIGYRLMAAVQRKPISAPELAGLSFRPGEPVTGRDQWKLSRRLDLSPSSEVWLAEHIKTREPRVFKFAADGLRLRALKREVTLARVLREALGERAHFVRIHEWNFDQAPYWLESEYGGLDLIGWSEQQGGLGTVALSERMDLLAAIAEAVGEAHGAGVLHKDLKPANVLVSTRADGSRQIKVADFGSGRLLGDELDALSITRLGFTQATAAELDPIAGTPLYIAPEVLAGGGATAAADVYALGVMLYQMIVGDFRKPMAPGWEADVDDELLREDIAAAAAGAPTRRLQSAAEMADRLRQLAARRADRQQTNTLLARSRTAEAVLLRARARRPWLIVAVGTLIAALVVSTGFYLRADESAALAREQAGITQVVNDFLIRDLMSTADPRYSESNQISLINAVRKASLRIDERFGTQPGLAAQLHLTVAQALATVGEPQDAREAFDRACPALQSQARIDCEIARIRLLSKLGEYTDAEHALAAVVPADGWASLPAQTELSWLMADADLAWQRDENEKAKAGARRSMQRYEELQALRPNDEALRDLGVDLRRLSAGILQWCRDLEAARSILKDLMPQAIARFGARNGLVIDIRNKAAINLIALRKLDEALPLAKSNLDDAAAAFGDTAIMTQQARGNLAFLYNQYTELAREHGEDTAQYAPFQQQAIALTLGIRDYCLQRFGESGYCVGALQDHALSLLNAGRHEEAATEYARTRSLAAKASGENSPSANRIAFLASEMLLTARQPALAKGFLDRVSLDELRAAMPDYALDCRWPFTWAQYHLQLRDFAKAVPLLKAASSAAPQSGENAYLADDIRKTVSSLPAQWQQQVH